MKLKIRAILILIIIVALGMPIAVSAADEPSSWAKSEVELAISLELVPQSLQNDYQASITRGDFCVLLMNFVNTQLPSPPEGAVNGELHNPFEDTHVYAVIRAYSLGIVTGKTESVFDPDGWILRQEAAAMLARAVKMLGVNISAKPAVFADGDKIAPYAKESVDFVSEAGIMQGMENGIFSPVGLYTREQAYMTALRLYNTILGIENEQTPIDRA